MVIGCTGRSGRRSEPSIRPNMPLRSGSNLHPEWPPATVSESAKVTHRGHSLPVGMKCPLKTKTNALYVLPSEIHVLTVDDRTKRLSCFSL